MYQSFNRNVAKCCELLRSVLTKAGVLIVVMVASASSAYGSCGDWLQHPAGEQSMDASHSAGTINLAGTVRFASTGALPFGKLPCDGPNCKSAPFVPSAPVPVSSVSFKTIKDYGCEQKQRSVADISEAELLYFEPEVSFLAGHRGRVERPPRAV